MQEGETKREDMTVNPLLTMFASLTAAHTSGKENLNWEKKLKFGYEMELNFSVSETDQKTMGRKERLETAV